MKTKGLTKLDYSVVPGSKPDRGDLAFTLVELLVVLTTLAILAVLLLPALGGSQPGRVKTFQCMNNLRQMGVAWTLYSEDNHDLLVNNYDTLNVQLEAKNKTYRSWANNFVNWNFADLYGNYNTNYDGITKAPFYGYTRSVGIYKCPADTYLSVRQQLVGGTLAWRPRSYSMNGFFGAPNPTWTSTANQFHPNFRQFLKTSAMPNPANLFLMMEEHPDSINDGIFQNDASPAISQYNDLPGSNHTGAGGFVFADGNVEIHQWKNRGITIQPVRYGSFSIQPFGSDPTGTAFEDGQWLASHSSVPK